MPSEPAHVASYQSNAALSAKLEAGGDLDWAITTMFYAALHLVEAYFSRAGTHSSGHVQRKRLIQNHPTLGAIWAEYSELEQRSKDARYQCLSFTLAQVQDLRASCFIPIELQLRGWLGI
ncbi:MAG: hypothetical protein ACYDCQ_05020 [Dehalococcoidia bacterium]